MATSTLASPTKTSRTSTLRWAAAIVAALLLLVVATVSLWVYYVARRELPQVDGSLTLSGITATVSV
ncbi:MAG TPA: hypothetical protein VJ453_02595, partial [Terriglobales bacterium]|nr:hypothetical protein [Terriglobales bacterium]